MADVLTPDICVIGAGSGGLIVAAAAASFGVDVVLIEKDKMGGDCLNYGCVPSKAILAAGKTAQAMRTSAKFGITPIEKPEINFRKVHDHVHDVIAQIAPNDSVERFTSLGVNVIEGAGEFIDAKTVKAADKIIKARRFVIATGSSAFVPPIEGLADVPYFTNENLFENTKKIEHLIIIGGGPIGMEMAQAHSRLGCKVTVIDAFEALGQDDPELTAIVLDSLRDEGINILEHSKVLSVAPKGKKNITVNIDKEGEKTAITGSHLLVATGRKPTIDGLGLENAGIKTNKRGIETKPDLKTTNKRAYAIGDVAGGLQFTHTAGYHAGLVIRGILFRKKAVPNNHITPWVTYTDPEIGNVGMNESQAREKYSDINILRWPYHENDRAIAERKTSGLIKMIVNKKGLILGVSIVGANAGEMINMWSLAISQKMKVRDVVGYISPYPTMTEIGKRAAVTYYAPFAKNKWLRRVIGFLRKFG